MVVINKSVISKFTYLKTILKVKDNGPESTDFYFKNELDEC